MEEKKTEGLTFSEATDAMRGGEQVDRPSWMGSMFLMLRNPDQAGGLSEPFIVLRRRDGMFEPWAPSHSDLLARDWRVA